ncbi:hypothetical protein SBF1_7920006 [Candidatus Desulfosporosinus infrequens]|uniref:Tn3 transposase DDE domain-containing protein n=1 Tax=Candidatus Desulfosporosinus infrequens TaxID=2043169 RepID=A0A2U3LS75_9FIRM|nr:hypothetical protein SBF1_7920006 [Candidatus Desulfosporosinus infrequens]
MEGEKKIEMIEQIKKVSPIAWQHINLGGKVQSNRSERTTGNCNAPACQDTILKYLR